MSAVVEVFRRVQVGTGRFVTRGMYNVPDSLSTADAKAVLTYPTWARLVEGELPDDESEPETSTEPPSNELLLAALTGLDDKAREAYWDQFTDTALNQLLLDRFEEPLKERSHGTAANMIEKRLGL